MKNLVLLLILAISQMAFAQKHITREAKIYFFGATDLENINATSNQVSSIIDTESGALVFQVLVNSFVFEKALMQEHFNENYAESETYPKTFFKGKFLNWSEVDIKKDGKYTLKVEGVLNFHGVEKNIELDIVLVVKEKKMSLTANFKIVPEDYNIEIPSAVRNKIAESFDVSVEANYQEKK